MNITAILAVLAVLTASGAIAQAEHFHPKGIANNWFNYDTYEVRGE